MTDELAKAKERIRKLLNMTTENGCSEDEQETALRLAAGAAAKAGIDLAAFQEAEAKATGHAAPKRRAVSKELRQEFKIHQVLAAQAAAALYGCEIYTYSHGKGGVFFVGREENIELCEQTMFWLMRQVELLYKQNLPRGLTQSHRADFRKTFKAACAHRVYERALRLMREMRYNDQAAQSATGQNALVVQGYFETLAQENRDYWLGTPEQQEQRRIAAENAKKREEDRRNALTPEQRAMEDKEREREQRAWEKKQAKRKGPRPRRLPVGSGTDAGFRAGDQVKLRKEIQ